MSAMPRYTRVLSTLALLCSALPATADAFVPQTPITVQVINDSGRPDSEVMLLLVGQDVAGKNSDGSTTTYPFSVSSVTSVDMSKARPPLTTGTPLACPTSPPLATCTTPATTPTGGALTVNSPYSGRQNLPVYQFTMSTVSSGTLFVSYDTGVSYPPAPTVTAKYRFQPLEFSYSSAIASNGDLTSIDFYGIPLQLETFGAGDTSLRDPLDRVTYYTSTPTMLKALTNASPDLQNAFVAKGGSSGNTIFVPGTTPANDFLRVIGPNQIAAPGTSPLPVKSTSPKPWPYPSFAGYLDALADAGYTFTEADANQTSAYTFSYTGTVTRMTSKTTASCLASSLAVDGWLIKLTGATAAPSPLPSNAEICIPLPRQDNGSGSADFFIYGAVQNCETLALASGGTLYPCSDSDPAALASLTNSVYGWIQADVFSALNFGYMGGAADASNGGKGRSGTWYGLPPVQYPFGLARSSNDGRYNPWAAFMYNHSDAYGFAFSDRKGRPSPDIVFPVGGTLRIWILPDERLDAPFVTVPTQDATSIMVQWPAVVGADHYVVTWSPPYETTSATVIQPASGTATYTMTGLDPGTPYTVTVRAFNADGSQRSHGMPLYARTSGTPPAAAAGNAQAEFGFNWTPPAQLSAQWPDLWLVGNKFGYGGQGSYSTPNPVEIAVGLPPGTAALTVTPATPCSPPCAAMSIDPPTIAPGGTATLTIVISNPATAPSLTLQHGFLIPMPPGVTAVASGAQCTGVAVNPTNIAVGAVTLNSSGPSCTITATLTSWSPGAFAVQAPALTTDAGTAPASSAALTVQGKAGDVALAIVPATIVSGGSATMSATLANVTGAPLGLTAPFVVALSDGIRITSARAGGSCTDASISADGTELALPVTSVIPVGGCTIIVAVTSSTLGTVIATSGILETPATLYPTRSFPMELRIGDTTIWSANYYLTFIGATTSYALGPCFPTEICAGSGLSPAVPFDTVRAPNFLDRQAGGLTITGGAANPGPPFGAMTPTVGVSFTPIADKKFAGVLYPKSGPKQAPRPPSCQGSKGSPPLAGCAQQ